MPAQLAIAPREVAASVFLTTNDVLPSVQLSEGTSEDAVGRF